MVPGAMQARFLFSQTRSVTSARIASACGEIAHVDGDDGERSYDVDETVTRAFAVSLIDRRLFRSLQHLEHLERGRKRPDRETEY